MERGRVELGRSGLVKALGVPCRNGVRLGAMPYMDRIPLSCSEVVREELEAQCVLFIDVWLFVLCCGGNPAGVRSTAASSQG